ncbi:MAG: hypothetical protein ACRDNR_12710, partial [Gaiellaceae bacterium]
RERGKAHCNLNQSSLHVPPFDRLADPEATLIDEREMTMNGAEDGVVVARHIAGGDAETWEVLAKGRCCRSSTPRAPRSS